jgi:hypothetical protein
MHPNIGRDFERIRETKTRFPTKVLWAMRIATCRILASTFDTEVIRATTILICRTHALHKEATMICGDMARDVAAQFGEMPEWRMDVSDEHGRVGRIGKSLFRLRLVTESTD